MNIRTAQERDIPRLAELLYQVAEVHHKGRPDLFLHGKRKYSDEELRALLRDAHKPILVCTDEQDRVLGYAFCVVKQRGNGGAAAPIKTLYIDDLCVDEACRGQHVGSALYDAALALARSLGCYNLTLNVWVCNENAMRFYESRGLKPQKIGMETIL